MRKVASEIEVEVIDEIDCRVPELRPTIEHLGLSCESAQEFQREDVAPALAGVHAAHVDNHEQ